MMKTIKTIDLWTEQHENHYECFKVSFEDEFENNKIPFSVLTMIIKQILPMQYILLKS